MKKPKRDKATFTYKVRFYKDDKNVAEFYAAHKAMMAIMEKLEAVI